MLRIVTLSPETALHRLRGLYRDAWHCDPPSDEVVLKWAAKPEPWAETQIRHRGWSWHVTEATVRTCRQLYRRASRTVTPAGMDPFDPLMPVQE